MSFSGNVKKELSRQWSTARHCQIAETAAIISMCGKVLISEKGEYTVKIHTENSFVARKYFTLLRKTYNIDTEISVRRSQSMTMYSVIIKNHEDSKKVLLASKLLDPYGDICENMSVSDNLIIQKECCKRAFIRGAFLVTGSISDPEKFYHFEIVCSTESKASQLKKIINSFHIDAKIVARKKHFVVYVKESEGIVDILNVMEAHVSLLEFENIRILKGMRNTVNRKVNCETANLNKTVSAAVKQVEDINYIKNTVGFSVLSENLEELARLRLEHTDSSLKELGQMLTVPVGKSGVNHRLRKISQMADDLRNGSDIM